MRIKKLELLGFKSFKDRTVIHFDEGITGVVGPNGCGKSNIVDALVWVMGEMSAKHLRGSSMEDVIFAGAEGYAPTGLAEVSLTLENDGGPFPVKYLKHSEIMVTRRLHRSGESEYLINKEAARLRDVQEIFMDTGAGSKGFSIVEQGAIGRIVTAKPDDRRSLIEEAAGITKFKVRKRESQRKLQSTEQNLVRLQDIIQELKRQIDSLQRQAQRAERYRKLKREIEDLELWTSSLQFLSLNEELKGLEQEVQSAEAELIALQSQMGTRDSDLEAMRERLLEQENEIQQWQQKAQLEQQKAQSEEHEVQRLRFEIEQAKHKKEVAGSLIEENETRRKLLEEDLARVTSRLETVEKDMLEVTQKFTERQAQLQEEEQGLKEVDDRLTEVRREQITVTQGVSTFEAKKMSLGESLEQIRQDQSDLEQGLESLQGEFRKFDKNRQRVVSELEKEKQLHLGLNQDFETLQGDRDRLDQEIKDKRSEVDVTKDELNQVTSRLYGLENLQDNMEGFQEGVRSVMFWQKERSQEQGAEQSLGLRPLAEAVEVPKDYELAMEAALGPKLQMLISEQRQTALDAVGYLKEQNKGRSSFFSSDLMVVESSTSSSHPEGQGVLAELKKVIRCEPSDQGILDRLLSNVAVVDSISTALELKPEFPEWTFVTTQGDLLSTEGVLTAGASESADSGVLKRRREIKELSERKHELAGKLALKQEVLKKLSGQLETMTEDLKLAQRKATEQEIVLAGLGKDAERAHQECENAKAALRKQELMLEDIKQKIQTREQELLVAEERLEELLIRRSDLEVESQTLQTSLLQAKGVLQDLSQEVTKLQVESAKRTQEYEGLSREHQMISRSYEDVKNQLGRMSRESDQSVETISTHQVEMEERKLALEKTIRSVEEFQSQVGALRDNYEKLLAETRKLEDSVHGERKNESHLQTKLNSGQLRLEQIRMKQTYLESQIEERYMVRLDQVAENYRDREGDPKESEEHLKDLKSKLSKIGEVNLSAIEEYDETAERYEFLKSQQEDLMDAKEQLKKVIDRIHRICNKRFKETFEAVNDRFIKVFPVLFGGGEAHLILIEDEEKGEMGIDIVAKPPGKKAQSVSLLSGGEKALTAVSLIFSIFLVKPSPYCLLDEVDAPLDDANVLRFNDLVKEMAKRSQIIVVTHNKHTMEVASKLYGVTMEEKGVSKMVSVNLTQAQEAVG